MSCCDPCRELSKENDELKKKLRRRPCPACPACPVGPSVNLTITQASVPASPVLDNTAFTITVTVTNTSTTTATNLRVLDIYEWSDAQPLLVPDAGINFTPSVGTVTAAQQSVLWAIPSLAASASATLAISLPNGLPTAPSSLLNTAYIINSAIFNSNEANNSSALTQVINPAP